jgi:cell division protein FtsI/penicillin-binding protein 2|uniref:Penicillin-binding protein 2 n=1 Tax=candidate division WOR-3 bacterium TaxID=2052148 RepID=A0A7V3VU09_UNCW3
MSKIKIFNGLLFLVSFVFFAYIFFIQCIKFRHFQEIARREHQKKITLCGTRGNIYDRNGLPIALSEPCFSIFCTPVYSPDKNRLTRHLAEVSEQPLNKIKSLVENNKFFWVERKVDGKKKDEYLKLDDPSIGFTHDMNRIYTMPEIFGSLIGKCDIDNHGVEGLEYLFDEILSGRSGFIVYQKEPNGDIFPYYKYPEKTPIPGQDLYLTIDLQFQTILYENLRECQKREEAKGAGGLIINPKTGEILAMVSLYADNRQRNLTICDEFEPGSTFKLVGLAYALQNGINENEKFDTHNGKLNIGGHIICDPKNNGILTLRQAIAHSSNVVMAELSRRFDVDNFLLFIKDFGFTQLTGIELPGETKGRLMKDKGLNEIEFATLLFGQGITCNLLQLAFAYQAVANNGILNKPYIVMKVAEGKRITYLGKPLRIRQVIDEETARRITNILCSVIEEGSGVEAKIDGLKIAGKTGTAQKVVDGKYSSSDVITTFIGFFPAEDPEYLIALLVDEPKRGIWAANVVAPIFKKVAQSICQIQNLQYAIK